jgi:hypothetical protein
MRCRQCGAEVPTGIGVCPTCQVEVAPETVVQVEQQIGRLQGTATGVNLQQSPSGGIVAIVEQAVDRLAEGGINIGLLYLHSEPGSTITIGSQQPSPVRPTLTKKLDPRSQLLENVRISWIEGLLQRSIHSILRINLPRQSHPQLVANASQSVNPGLDIPDSPPTPQGAKVTGNSYLILGEPGSGKTMMLLELTRDLIAQAEADVERPIPVVFNLASWKGGRPNLTAWLVEELDAQYGVHKRIGRDLVENERLSLLLDGLDEVPAGHRKACVRAINDFRRTHHSVDLVICSRLREYQEIATELKLWLDAAVVLLPLSTEQIDQCLADGGPKLTALRARLKEDRVLQDLAQTPLMLSIMRLVYEDLPEGADLILSQHSIQAFRTALLRAYVRRMFDRSEKSKDRTGKLRGQPERSTDAPYSRALTMRWLSWLAEQMNRHNHSIFLIERMQPSWLATGRQFWIYVFVSRLLGCSVMGLVPLVLLMLDPSRLRVAILFAAGVVVVTLIGGARYRIKANHASPLLTLRQGLFSRVISGRLIGWAVFLSLIGVSIASHTLPGLRDRPNRPVQSVRPPVPPSSLSSISHDQSSRYQERLEARAVFDQLAGRSVEWFMLAIYSIACTYIFGLKRHEQDNPDDIRPVGTVSLSVLGMIGGAIKGAIFGLVLALPGALFGCRLAIAKGESADLFNYTLLGCLLFGSIGMFMCGIVRAMVGLLVPKQIRQSKNQNDAIRKSLGLAFTTWVFGTALPALLLCYIVWKCQNAWWALLAIVSLLGVVLFTGAFSLRMGGLAALQHGTLHLILCLQGQIPWSYRRFLDYCDSLILLRKVGGGYIFVHRFLLEYFASLEEHA